MKRIVPLFTASALAFTLAACSSSAKTSTTATTAAATATTAAATATTAGSATTTAGTATTTAATTGGSATTTAATTGGSATTTASTGGTKSGDASAEAAAAAKRVAPYLAPVTKIAYDTKLKSVPAKGKKLYWLEGNIQSILPITGGFKSAAAALGWNLTVLTYDPSDPQGPNSALQQAVDAGADFIAESGQNATTLKTGLAAAKAKNIPVFGMFGDNDSDPNGVGLYTSVGGPPLTLDNAKAMSDFFISDSKAAGKVVIVNLPDFKILQIAEKATRDAIAANCTACTVDAIEGTLADLTGGNIAPQVVSYLQKHPDVKYVNCFIGDLATGLPQALKAAGMSDVKIIGSVPNVDQIQSLIDKTSTAWFALPRVEGAWQVVDAMARYSEGMDFSIADTIIPRPIFTQDNVTSPATDYAGVPDFEAQFKALWGV